MSRKVRKKCSADSTSETIPCLGLSLFASCAHFCLNTKVAEALQQHLIQFRTFIWKCGVKKEQANLSKRILYPAQVMYHKCPVGETSVCWNLEDTSYTQTGLNKLHMTVVWGDEKQQVCIREVVRTMQKIKGLRLIDSRFGHAQRRDRGPEEHTEVKIYGYSELLQLCANFTVIQIMHFNWSHSSKLYVIVPLQ